MAGVGRNDRSSWGVPVFVFAILAGIAIWYVWTGGSLSAEASEPVLATIGGIGAFLASYVSHTAYPRVHNLKIYVLGIGIATTSLVAILVVFGLPQIVSYADATVRPAALFLAYAAGITVLLATVAAPEFASFTVTRRAAAAIVLLIAICNLVGLLIPAMRESLASLLLQFRSTDSTVFWVFGATTASILLITVFREAHSLGIGGIHAGAAALFALGWAVPGADTLLHGLILAAVPLFLSLAILVHWFQRLENRAWYDPVVRIYNRSYCDLVLEERGSLDTRPPFAILLIDLDHFKAINDTHGHIAGDLVLRDVGQLIRSIVVPNGVAARYGGEEIICFLAKTDADRAKTVAEMIRAEIERMNVSYKKKKITVTASLGCAVRESVDQALSIVLGAADKALYSAKNAGRNCVRVGRLRKKGRSSTRS